MPAETQAGARTLAAKLGLEFGNLHLLSQALVHSSYTNEKPEAGEANERLEFLGDAVLALIVSEILWQRYPGEDEGSLTTRRAAVVSAQGLAGIAERLDLGAHLLLGQGARQAGERTRQSVLAGVFEAVLGAIYLEFGLEETRQWFLSVASPELDESRSLASLKPAKSALQELGYERTGRSPHYELLSSEGPPHERHFVVEVSLGGEPLARGSGRSRREAETEAATAALVRLAGGPAR